MTTKKSFPKKYSTEIPIEKHLANAKKEYKKGNFIEAFVMLYSLTEFLLNMIWFNFARSYSKNANEPKEKEYGVLVDMLFETGVIDDKIRCSLMEFKKGRNNYVHYLFKTYKVTLSKKTLDSQFQQGVKLYPILWKMLQEWMEKADEFISDTRQFTR